MPSSATHDNEKTLEKTDQNELVQERDLVLARPTPTQLPLTLTTALARLLDTLLACISRLAAFLTFTTTPTASPTTTSTSIATSSGPSSAGDYTEKTSTTSTSSNTNMSTTTNDNKGEKTSTKTVVVLGCAYGGARAAQILAAGLPADWRVVVLDRNSHANHVYVMPRFAVLPAHEYKAFIPYTNVFLQNKPEDKPEEKERFQVLHAQVKALKAHSVTYTLLSSSSASGNDSTSAETETKVEKEKKEHTLDFDFAIYALGAHMPPPLDLWSSSPAYAGFKSEGCEFFVDKQEEIRRVVEGKGCVNGQEGGSVLVVGGGALGIQFATDIKAVYPHARVTLLHSRDRLLPRFAEGMHEEIVRSCAALGVDVILGERLDLGSLSTTTTTTTKEASSDTDGGVKTQKVVRTVTGREIVTDLVLMCTGQTPNTALLAGLDSRLVEPRSRHARVHRTMQVAGRTVYVEDSSAAAGATTASAALTTAVVAVSESESAGEKKTDEGKEEVKQAEEALANLGLTSSEGTTEVQDENDNDKPYPHIFAIGDAAAAFGAIPAGHCAFSQGEVAARNVVRLVKRLESESESENKGEKAEEGEVEELEEYKPGAPAIKVSLGLERSVYEVGGAIGVKEDGVPDLHAGSIWPYFGIKVEKDEDMRA